MPNSSLFGGVQLLDCIGIPGRPIPTAAVPIGREWKQIDTDD